tara:strand:- start:714 stop:1235 length:522 start_codon:yes stop_codon:yes gene_type:complete
MKNPTQGTIQKVTSEEVITSFYGLDGAAAAIKASTFDVMEELNTIIQHVRDPDPKVSLPALRQFRGVMKEIVSANGMIGNVTQTEMVPDSNVSRTMSSSTLLTNLRNQNGEINDQKEIKQKHEILCPLDGSNRETKEEEVKPKSNQSSGDTPNDGDDGTNPRSSSIDPGCGNL